MGSASSLLNFAPHRFSGLCPGGFAYPDPLPAWTGTTNGRLRLPSCVTPLLMTAARWYRNINRLSIAYAQCLGLGPD